MTRLRTLILLLLIALPLLSVQAQGVPPQLTLVLNALSSRLNQPLTVHDLTSWSYEQNIYTDSALGCPYVVGTSMPQGISGMHFTLVYQGVSYDYRVTTDGSSLFACEPPAAAGQPTTAPAGANCPADFAGYLPPRLEVGGQASIGPTGTPNRLRGGPSVNAQQIGLIKPGSTVKVLDGPSCEDSSHIIWWRVSDNGTVGWTAEGQPPSNYFLDPVGGTLPNERNLITAQNASALSPLTTLAVPGVNSISFTADGILVAFGGRGGLSVYNTGTMMLNTHLSDPSTPVIQVAFSPDGRYLAYATASALMVYDTTASTRTTLANLNNNPVNSLAFSPDQRHLLAVGLGTAVQPPGTTASWQLYNMADMSQPPTIQPTASWVRAVAFSPDGTLFAWVDNALHAINSANSSPVLTMPLTASLRGLTWRPSPAGTPPIHAVAFVDGAQIHLVNFDAKTQQNFSANPNFFADALAFNRDGSLLAAMNTPNNSATASTINIFNPDTAALIASLPFNPSKALAFSPDGTLLLVATNDNVLLLGANDSASGAG